ncbi:GNAT family N-acetyltransferase [Mycobacterium yunnanensis]|uniref:GNAT family N-acetyltransferase n=1 Tax=Mycobacterium yunnanensis TaxID=368477 RepID=A0A9X2YXE0_9MYCO|nr:GNAT family N-acetyltransferase [Mycobacterium yunnanensis]MCV7419535.1 GNAT family N-acetyltransferase [Mycobacterium yunnanensis]
MKDSPTPSLRIEVLSVEAASDVATVRDVVELVNKVYAVAEDGLWQQGATRTTRDEIIGFIRAGQIVVARLDDRIVGSIHVQRLDSDTAETGMLASDPDYRGMGIGRELRRFVVDQLRRDGVTVLQIELLVPRNWTQESKVFMADWNARSGYQVVRKGRFEDHYPHLAPRLATPCDFIVYNKPLDPTTDVGPDA